MEDLKKTRERSIMTEQQLREIQTQLINDRSLIYNQYSIIDECKREGAQLRIEKIQSMHNITKLNLEKIASSHPPPLPPKKPKTSMVIQKNEPSVPPMVRESKSEEIVISHDKSYVRMSYAQEKSSSFVVHQTKEKSPLKEVKKNRSTSAIKSIQEELASKFQNFKNK